MLSKKSFRMKKCFDNIARGNISTNHKFLYIQIPLYSNSSIFKFLYIQKGRVKGNLGFPSRR